jgi:hypothetical protein
MMSSKSNAVGVSKITLAPMPLVASSQQGKPLASGVPLMVSSVPGLHGPRLIERSNWIAYLAGYIDGEGSFALYRKGNARLCVSNTFPGVLAALKKEWGGSIRRKSTTNPNARTAWEWVVDGDNAINAALMVSPYLIEKRTQASLMTQIRTWPPGSEQRKQLIQRIKSLKRIDYGKESV